MSEKKGLLRDTIVLGIIGYSSVAALYAIFDLLAARGFLFTVNLLGMAVFRGFRDITALGYPMELDMNAIYIFSALHLFLSFAIGLTVSKLIEISEVNSSKARLIFTILISGFFITIIGVGMFTEQIRQLLPWWSIVTANTIAVVIATYYLIKKHPGIWERLGPLA